MKQTSNHYPIQKQLFHPFSTSCCWVLALTSPCTSTITHHHTPVLCHRLLSEARQRLKSKDNEFLGIWLWNQHFVTAGFILRGTSGTFDLLSCQKYIKTKKKIFAKMYLLQAQGPQSAESTMENQTLHRVSVTNLSWIEMHGRKTVVILRLS